MTSQDLTAQINTLGFKAVVVFIITAVVSVFLPLEAPVPTQEDAAYWLMNTMSGYVFGWVNQIIAMLACAAIFAYFLPLTSEKFQQLREVLQLKKENKEYDLGPIKDLM